MKLRSVVGITLLIYSVCSIAQQPSTIPDARRFADTESSADGRRPIGTATMLRNRTIVLDLRGEIGDAVGHAQFSYKPGDPDYARMLVHLNGIKPGETKVVPPFGNPLSAHDSTAK
jgi:hypothetical protein